MFQKIAFDEKRTFLISKRHSETIKLLTAKLLKPNKDVFSKAIFHDFVNCLCNVHIPFFVMFTFH